MKKGWPVPRIPVGKLVLRKPWPACYAASGAIRTIQGSFTGARSRALLHGDGSRQDKDGYSGSWPHR